MPPTMMTLCASDWLQWPALWLIAQALAATASVGLFRTRVASNVHALHDDRAIAASIGPLAMAIPMVAGAFRTDWNINHDPRVASWIALGAPVACGLLALGIASISTIANPSSRQSRIFISSTTLAAWTFAGMVLLLLGAAHDLTIWVGQCAFAAGAILLWMNTPEIAATPHGSADSQAASGLSLMLLCGIVQALAVGLVPSNLLHIAGGVLLMNAAMIFAISARLAGPDLTMRLGGWTATLAILLSLGAISLRHMVPRAIAVIQGSSDRPPSRVASGFGSVALEATIMLALGALAFGLQQPIAPAFRRALGWVTFLAAAALAGLRLAAG